MSLMYNQSIDVTYQNNVNGSDKQNLLRETGCDPGKCVCPLACMLIISEIAMPCMRGT